MENKCFVNSHDQLYNWNRKSVPVFWKCSIYGRYC
jgi:hypothetical protein